MVISASSAEQPSALVGVRGEPVMMLAGIGADHQVLAPVLDIAERPAIFERQPGDAQLLGLHDELVAEAAADVGRDHAHLALIDPEELRQSRRG